MALKQSIECDITGCEMDQDELNRMTVVNIHYKHMGKVQDPRSGEDIECVTALENYQLHICSEKAAEFMQGIKELLIKLRGE
jgi:hypothetical protein